MASPPPSGLAKKPHLPFPEQPSTIQQISSKSHSNSICKTLIILVLLLIIPFFPSQAPDFIRQTIFTQFWEIIHLLFIGIAVSYGLFGRKSEKTEISRNDDSNAYLSGISHLSSIFEDGFGNMCCGPDEQDVMIQSYYANCNCQCFGDQILGKSRCVVHGGSSSSTKIRSFVSKNGRENIICDGNEENVKNQTWSSKSSKGESLVVVANGEHFLGESYDFKPLNLPVRSLRSNVVDNEKLKSQNHSESSPKIEAKGKNDVKVQKIRGVVPTNLTKRFEESDGLLSTIPWRSRSGRMEIEEEFSNIKPHVHCRPHSIGEFNPEHIKSRSSNKVSNFSSSPESASSKMENVEGEMIFSASRPKIAPLTADEESFSDSRARTLSVGNNCEEDKVGKGKQPIESLDSDTKSSAIAKALSRAKSVRTIKPSRYVVNQKDDKLERMCNDFEANTFVRRGKREEPENPLVNYQNEEIDRHFSMPKPKPSLPDVFDEEKEDNVDENDAESEEESEGDRVSELNESADEEDAKTNVDYDLGSEVDRKAGEFIAKFREQIRLQKASSTEGYSQELL